MRKKLARGLLSTAVLFGAFSLAGAQDASSGQGAAPDNTKINQRDRDSASPTADQGKSNASDLKLAQQIRKSIVKDKALSTYAHNIKVIVQDGAVTLKGPVKTEDDKKALEAKAADLAGADKVTNQIEVVSQ